MAGNPADAGKASALNAHDVKHVAPNMRPAGPPAAKTGAKPKAKTAG